MGSMIPSSIVLERDLFGSFRQRVANLVEHIMNNEQI